MKPLIPKVLAVFCSISLATTGAPSAQANPEQDVQELELANGHTLKILSTDNNGNPTSGVVSFDINESPPSGQATFRLVPGTNTENIGGGTWTYGWKMENVTGKLCFSHYIHNSKHHTASVAMGDLTSKRTARAGSWAKASVRGSITTGTCNAYWSTGA